MNAKEVFDEPRPCDVEAAIIRIENEFFFEQVSPNSINEEVAHKMRISLVRFEECEKTEHYAVGFVDEDFEKLQEAQYKYFERIIQIERTLQAKRR